MEQLDVDPETSTIDLCMGCGRLSKDGEMLAAGTVLPVDVEVPSAPSAVP
jgi:predicted RNA methylase